MQTREGYYYLDSLGGEADHLPVILIHGAGGSYLNWPVGFRHIPGYRVLTLDLPGHGRSDGSACGSVKGYAEAINCYLKEASIYQAILVGYSLGGQVALQFAMDYPNQCGGLGLIACSDDFLLPTAVVEMLANGDTYPTAVDLLQSMFLEPACSEKMYKKIKESLFTCRNGTIIADINAMCSFHIADYKQTVTNFPIWICAAREDKVNSFGSAHLLAMTHPGCTFTIIQQAGHGVLLEKPQQVQRGLYQFLGI